MFPIIMEYYDSWAGQHEGKRISKDSYGDGNKDRRLHKCCVIAALLMAAAVLGSFKRQ